jgi:PAS domain S-box-containing protein
MRVYEAGRGGNAEADRSLTVAARFDLRRGSEGQVWCGRCVAKKTPYREKCETDLSSPSQAGMMLGTNEEALAVSAAPCPAVIQQDAGYQDFLRMAEASAAMIWIADEAGLCTYANRSWLEFRGRSLEQELGTGWTEGNHPEDANATLRQYWQAFRARMPLRIEYRIECKGGVYQIVERLGSPWYGPDGELCGYSGSMTLIGAAGEDREAKRLVENLSARERQVFEMIALGYSTRQIAAELGISYKTADSHRTHVLKKLGVHETASLVRLAIRASVIRP